MTHQLRIAPNTGDERIIDDTRLISGDYNKTHTGVGDYSVTVPYDLSLEDRLFDEVLFEDGSTLLFRGDITSVSSDDKASETRIRGEGIGADLKDDEATVTYTNTLAHDAISDYWSNQTSFTATVTTPTADKTITSANAQTADSTSEFQDVTSPADTDPVEARNGNLELLQTSFVEEGELNATNTNSNSDASDGSTGLVGGDTDDSLSWTFNPDYDIPKEDFDIAVRAGTGDSPDPSNFEWTLDGEVLGSDSTFPNSGFNWVTNFIDGESLSAPSSDVAANTSHTLKVSYTGSGSDDFEIDVIQIYDTGDRYSTSFSYTYDNDNGGSSGYLDGPELFPDKYTFVFDGVSTTWNITDGTLSTTWDDTTGDQRIQLQIDSTWFPNNGTEDNTSSVTTDFGSENGSGIKGRARLSRYGSTTGQTPLTGINGQKIQDWTITFDGNDIAIFNDITVEGSHLQNLQRLHEDSDMRFTVLHKEGSKEVESYQIGDVTKTLPDITSINETRTKDGGQYANHVTVRGQRVNGTRLTQTESDSTEISNNGQEHAEMVDPTLENQDDVSARARSFLAERLRELKLKGQITFHSQDIDPGFNYPNPFDSAEEDVPLEEVRYAVRSGDVTGTLIFDFRAERLAEALGDLRMGQSNTKRGF